jgi:hypothetical protein
MIAQMLRDFEEKPPGIPLDQTTIQRAQSQENAFATTARVAQQAKTDKQPSWKHMADEKTVNFVDAFP